MGKIKGVDDKTWEKASAEYAESDAVKNLGAEVQKAYQNYTGWESSGAADKALAKWKNTAPFSYDPDSDALYQNARANAIAAGKVAMDDTVGRAAAMTGGYGNSYAITAGSQAYQDYLKGLDDDLATYYQLALDQYQRGKDDLLTEYQLETTRDEAAYGRLYDAYGLASDRYNTERSFDYNAYLDGVQQAQQLASMQNTDAWAQVEFDEDAKRYDQEYALALRSQDHNEAMDQANLDLAIRQQDHNEAMDYKNYALDQEAMDLNWAQYESSLASGTETSDRWGPVEYADRLAGYKSYYRTVIEKGGTPEEAYDDIITELWGNYDRGGVTYEDFQSIIDSLGALEYMEENYDFEYATDENGEKILGNDGNPTIIGIKKTKKDTDTSS